MKIKSVGVNRFRGYDEPTECVNIFETNFFLKYRDPWRPPFLSKDWQGFLSGFAKIGPSGVSRETDGPTHAFHFPMGTILIRTRSWYFGHKRVQGI